MFGRKKPVYATPDGMGSQWPNGYHPGYDENVEWVRIYSVLAFPPDEVREPDGSVSLLYVLTVCDPTATVHTTGTDRLRLTAILIVMQRAGLIEMWDDDTPVEPGTVEALASCYVKPVLGQRRKDEASQRAVALVLSYRWIADPPPPHVEDGTTFSFLAQTFRLSAGDEGYENHSGDDMVALLADAIDSHLAAGVIEEYESSDGTQLHFRIVRIDWEAIRTQNEAA